jgi:hypothetical protein
MTTAPLKLRVLFCIGVTQNFFDLPSSEIGTVWQAYGVMLQAMSKMPGLRIMGTMDDDQLMVGTSASWPWTAYIMAEADALETVVVACNLFRVTPVGEHKLWRYGRIEARVGRELVVPE